MRAAIVALVLFLLSSISALAQSGSVAGVARDETGGVLPGVTVQLRAANGTVSETTTNGGGLYAFNGVANGHYVVTFTLINFGSARSEVDVNSGSVRAEAVMHLSMNADVIVTGKSTFTNLADVADPERSLVGTAQSASQGAITARQLNTRPIMRAGEVLEAVPGVIISQHSGGGKANQYYLRGFNLDHGTDFATTLAGMPVNMPTHGHGHGYSDSNFLIPELVSGVQFSKGPYFAEQGDFATAGAANINYVNFLDKTMVRVGGGGQGFSRALVAASPKVGSGFLMAALEVEHNDGPWERGDDYQKVNGLVRYTRGDTQSGWSVTGMGYRGEWNSTDQVPQRAIAEGEIGRFGNLDNTAGGDTYRYSGSFEWQRAQPNASTKLVAYGIGYDLNLFSNFTFFLDDQENGDQFHQADHRFVTGAKLSHRRIGRLLNRPTQNTVGVQLRNDDIGTVGLYHTRRRELIDTVREDAVLQTSVGGYAQNETAWAPWLRTLAGLRVDGYRFNVDAGDPQNGGTVNSGIVSPKGGVVLGPWSGTEFYANAGYGFHSNDARGATITRDPKTGDPADSVTPLVRATGSEVGVRTVTVPHLQTSLSLWTLDLASELLFVGDAGSTEASRPSHRWGVEINNYYSPKPWLTFDADLAWSRSHFTDNDPAGDAIPGAVNAVVAAGATIDTFKNFFGSVRLRYFGPRPLIEDDSVRSKATRLVNVQGGYQFTRNVRLMIDGFNIFDAAVSDVDYFYASRLQGEPDGGVDDIHFHPTLPRTARVNLVVGF